MAQSANLVVSTSDSRSMSADLEAPLSLTASRRVVRATWARAFCVILGTALLALVGLGARKGGAPLADFGVDGLFGSRWSWAQSAPDTASRPLEDLEAQGDATVVDAGSKAAVVGARPSLPFKYNADVAQKLAQMARATKCDSSRGMANWTRPPCQASGLKIVNGTFRGIYHKELGMPNSTYVMVAKLQGPDPFSDGCLVAVVRGSSNNPNSIVDAEFWQARLPADWGCKGCWAHHGFLSTWLNVEQQVHKALMDIGCTSSSGLFITGHSMGAGMASLAAWSFKHKYGFQLRMVYTFESPRVANKVFADAYDADIGRTVPTFRITYNHDIVPQVPPRFAGFQHFKYEVFYSPSGSYHVCPFVEDTSCAAQFRYSPW
eukprot:CAMPEP_0180571154 /NCGR_PEP_ID=MMETSP1037_2-20121125/8568_1 /TAXON_ID=632150 /ORGANISM="Azadinium spinosum, Strain 3D9" /LENGTH=375 /DNA_ID=CAMNT_0022588453 /DNA_START=17 /DNA_END=1141 /DNA_ORIENTATION=-